MVTSMIFEIFGISLIPAYIYALTSFDQIHNYIPQSLTFILNLEKNELILFLSTILILFFILKNLIQIFTYKVEADIIGKLVFKNASRIFSFYIKNPLEFHYQNNPSELIKNLTISNRQAGEIIRIIINIVREICLIFFLLIILFYVNFFMTLSVIIVLSLFTLLFYYKFKIPLTKMGLDTQTHVEKQIKILNHSFHGIREVKIFKIENLMKKLFDEQTFNWLSKDYLSEFYSKLPRIFFEVLAILLLVIFLTSLILSGQTFEYILPLLTLYGVTLIRFIPSFTLISSNLNFLSYYKEAYKIISNLLEKIDSTTEFKDSTKKTLLDTHENKIELSNVYFNYSSRKENKVINNLNLKFNCGEIVGIFGKSGQGKSTLLDLLMGLINPVEGNIFYNGENIKNNSETIQKAIGYVSQSVYLFDDTLLKNITFLENLNFKKDKKLDEAILESYLSDVIEDLPQKILTNVGNMGSNLSGGQIQRIGIARALYKNPEILILDEATNSVDKETEKKILLNFKSSKYNKKIIILISHDPKIVQYCNRVIFLKKGRVLKDLKENEIKNLDEKKIIEIM